MKKMASLVLLQRDLRLRDNPALFHAARRQKPVIVCYVMEKRIGSASKWWLCESLQKFRKQLQEHGIPLLHLSNPSKLNEMIAYLNKNLDDNIDRIFSNGLDFEVSDDENFAKLHEQHMSHLIFDPADMDRQFKVFTPYWKYVCANCVPIKPLSTPSWTDHNRLDVKFDEYSELPKVKNDDRWDKMGTYWNIGEVAAQERYRFFVDKILSKYAESRDYFNMDGSSKLSPHLRFGEISVRQIYDELSMKKSNDRYCAELGWREFAYHINRNYPDISTIPINTKYKDFWPEYNEEHLNAWKTGHTGFPVIDAGMRCLWETGWLHNRLRMLVGSFLVKNLLIPWQIGEQWFYDNLIDSDPAVNPFSWQWVAGCGTDSVPYFRIFNPILQGDKFDPDGIFVKQWVPELAKVGTVKKNFHESVINNTMNMRPKNYPKPIIDFKASRERTLSIFKSINSANVVELKKPRTSK